MIISISLGQTLLEKLLELLLIRHLVNDHCLRGQGHLRLLNQACGLANRRTRLKSATLQHEAVLAD
ncbi:hypothetical protein BG46_04740 [Brucella anthropi]|nr:hypothetical protein BG46_04740 [Brucella anthropi]